jgi:hypothetical protein
MGAADRASERTIRQQPGGIYHAMPTPLRVFAFDRRGRRRSRPDRCQSLEDCPPKLPHRRYKPGRGALLAREVRDCAESKQSTIAWLHLPRFCSCYRFSAQVPGRIVSSPSCTDRRYRVQQAKRCMEHRSSQRANRFLVQPGGARGFGPLAFSSFYREGFHPLCLAAPGVDAKF